MINRILIFSFGCCLALTSCLRTERITLAIDFSQAHTWRYLFGVDITGVVQSEDSSRTFSGALRTFLAGERSPHDFGAIRLKTSRPLITADFLSEGERIHLERQFENMVLNFSPKEGAVELPDTALPPSLTIGGWDLFRNFARVLPILPESPVRRGATWDRARSFPIETSIGSATGSLFQTFTLDSIMTVDSSRYAGISWIFTYRIEPNETDTVSYLDTLPLRGEGRGDALIDLGNKRIVKAHADFEAQPRPGARLGISWRESVHLELIE